ncbi:type II secretion system F family protein [Gallaecimonas pentaromativorans]|uniref:MSHA biogenesis protein MshG n=1 Tax=Gallaecimonas pentaromativorans TaxID=584787 RepID=A0A3N1PVP9_9GAMM|nr:type II secretion system F family protein [Gallaecimonas pentaromativorans]ROQ30837.1 MSHA biogenesis protein MshG [Gallaecimonas pentaromativorans]
MSQFYYRGKDERGQVVKGLVDAGSEEAAFEQLLGRRIRAESLRPARQPIRFNLFEGRVELDDMLMLCRQMYSLTKAGIPILRAVAGMAETSPSKVLRKVLADVATQLEAGRNLSTALSRHPKVFSSLFVSMIHVGENTGRLDEAFAQLCDHLNQEQETRRRVKSAVRYPSFVVIAIAIAIAVVNLKVIPQFAEIFKRFHAELPLPTRILVATSDFFVHYWLWLLLAIGAAVTAWLRWLQTDKGRLFWDTRKLRLPIVGSLINRALLARFARSLGMMLKAGVPLPQALSLVADAVDNQFMKNKILAMRQGIEGGESLLRSGGQSQLFSPLILQMFAVGEETGNIDEMLLETAGFYEREVDYDLANLTARIEPILIVFVAALVLLLALGVFLPMWDLMRAYKGQS